jgi:hypothetical protein
MPGITQAADRTSSYRSYGRSTWSYRPVAGLVYTPGLSVQLVSQDLQLYPDAACVGLAALTGSQQKMCGIVAETWPGFSGSLASATPYTAPTNLGAVRGTLVIDVVVEGFHPAVFVDQSGAAATTITDGLTLVASRATAGYLQGVGIASAPGGSGVMANAFLPGTGFGSSLTAAALAQASQTDTIAGAPAAGDVLTMTLQTPWIDTAAGVLQTTVFMSPQLTTAQAVSVTTAAAAFATFLNAQAAFNKFWVAAAVAGVITVTVNTLSAPYHVNFATGIGGIATANAFDISLSGMLANTLTFAVGYTQAGASTGTATAGGATFAGGTGFKGTIPAFAISTM